MNVQAARRLSRAIRAAKIAPDYVSAMYATCLFCNNALGTNQVLEHSPVGRRLAFDEAKGRLWVICGTCKRWNLSPLETRWEAIEEAERAYRGTRLRMATDNIGLARLSEGLELVRIGAPLRPEFAAWRYGDQFSGRHKKARLYTYVGLSVATIPLMNSVATIMGVAATTLVPTFAAMVAMTDCLPATDTICGKRASAHHSPFATTKEHCSISQIRMPEERQYFHRERGSIGN